MAPSRRSAPGRAFQGRRSLLAAAKQAEQIIHRPADGHPGRHIRHHTPSAADGTRWAGVTTIGPMGEDVG